MLALGLAAASRFDEKDSPRGMFTSQATLKRSSRVSSGLRELKALCALLVVTFALCPALSQSAAAEPLTVKVGVIREAHSRETISILDIPPTDDFIAGARYCTRSRTPCTSVR